MTAAAEGRLDAFGKKVEALGDVLCSVAQTGTRHDSLRRGLEHIAALAARLTELNERSPEAFQEAVVPDGFRAMAERNPDEAAFRAWIAPDVVFAGFRYPLEQIYRVFVSAVRSSQDEAAKRAADCLEDVLERIVAAPGNGSLVKIALRTSTQLTRYALDQPFTYVPVVAWGWFDTVALIHPAMGYRPFDIEYLEDFITTLWTHTRLLMRRGREDLYESLVDSLIGAADHYHGSRAPDPYDQELRAHFRDEAFRDWARQAETLDRERQHIGSLSDLKAWREKVELYASGAPDYMTDEGEGSFGGAVAGWLASGEGVLKRNRVRALLFSSGSYAIFNERYEWLPLLIDHAQPKDSDASWAGWNPFPRNLDQVIQHYLLPLASRDGLDFWEGRHGHTGYDEEFALLLILRELASMASSSTAPLGEQTTDSAPADAAPQLPAFNTSLGRFSLQEVKNLDWLADRIKPACQRLADKPHLLLEVGVSAAQQEWLLGEALPAYLDSMKQAAKVEEQRRVLDQDLSAGRIEAFAAAVHDAFVEAAPFRALLVRGGHASTVSEVKEGMYGMNTLIPRNAFLDISYEHWSMADDQLGRELGSGVDHLLVSTLVDSALPSQGSLDDALREFGVESTLILTARVWDPDSLIDMTRFSTIGRDDPTRLPGQAGWYAVDDDCKVPVIENYRLRRRGTLVVREADLGRLTEYEPVPSDCGRLELRMPISVCVREVLEDSQLAEQLLSEQPEWLQNVPAGTEPEKALRSRVWLRVLVSYEYEPEKQAAILLLRDADSEDDTEA